MRSITAPKYGLDDGEGKFVLEQWSESRDEATTKGARIVGVMGMATYTDNSQQVRAEFDTLANSFRTLKHLFFDNQDDFKELSMGRSGEFDIALDAGSTMVRVGSLIFGAR